MKKKNLTWSFPPDYTEENRQITINNIINDTDEPLKEFKIRFLPNPQGGGRHASKQFNSRKSNMCW